MKILMPKVKKAVIVDAGLGSRMFPYTKVESKLMIPILGKPAILYLAEELASSGIEEVIIVSSHTAKLKQLFEKDEKLNFILKELKMDHYLDEIKRMEGLIKVEFIKQVEPRGWMHEIFHAEKYLKEEPFVVCFSDIIYESKIPASKQIINAFKKTKKNIRSQARFLLKPNSFKIIEKEHFRLGQDVADLDVFEKLREKDDLYEFNIQGDFYDIGNILSHLKTQTQFALKHPDFGKEYKEFLKQLIK